MQISPLKVSVDATASKTKSSYGPQSRMTYIFRLPVELITEIGQVLTRNDAIALSTTCSSLRRILARTVFGGRLRLLSPFPNGTNTINLFYSLRANLPALYGCNKQLALYCRNGLFGNAVRRIEMVDWIVPTIGLLFKEMQAKANNNPTVYAPLFLELKENLNHYIKVLSNLRYTMQFWVQNVLARFQIFELKLVRTQITQGICDFIFQHETLKKVILDDCPVDGSCSRPTVPRRSLTVETVLSDYKKPSKWSCAHMAFATCTLKDVVFSSWLTKLEISMDWVPGVLNLLLYLPAVTHLTVLFGLPYWEWKDFFNLLLVTPNVETLRFEPSLDQTADEIYEIFDDEDTDWIECEEMFDKLPLLRLSSVTTYNPLIQVLLHRKERRFEHVEIILLGEYEDTALKESYNWRYDVYESDVEVDAQCEPTAQDIWPCFILPGRSWISVIEMFSTPLRTLHLRYLPIEEHQSPFPVVFFQIIAQKQPQLEELWVPSLIGEKWLEPGDPKDKRKGVFEFVIAQVSDFPKLRKLIVGNCSPEMAKGLSWHKESDNSFIVAERGHPSLKEVVLDVSYLWEWHDDDTVPGWRLFLSHEIADDDGDESDNLSLSGLGDAKDSWESICALCTPDEDNWVVMTDKIVKGLTEQVV